MNYFEYRDKRPALDVIDWPQIQVSEKQLTDEEIRQWTKTINEKCTFGSESPSAASSSGPS